MKNVSRRPAYPVLPVFTHEWGAWDGTMTKQTVNSKTAAIRLCRNLGYRVLTKGGLVELVTCRIDSETGSEHLAWSVTVHPEV